MLLQNLRQKICQILYYLKLIDSVCLSFHSPRGARRLGHARGEDPAAARGPPAPAPGALGPVSPRRP